MHKRLSIPVTVLALLLSTAACGSDDDSTNPAAEGLSGDPVKVALIVPLTGASAKTAEQMQNAAELAVEEVNEDGGIDGRPLELQVYDDELKPENAAREAQRAITRDGAVAIVGAQSSGEALAIREVVERAEVPFITSSATVEAITEDAEYTYRIAPLLTDYANGVVDIGKALGLEKPAVVHDSGGAGILLKDLFIARAKEAGVTLAGTPIEYPLNGTDMSAQVAAAAQQNPDGVLIGGSAGGDHGLVAKTMVEQGLDVPLVGFSPILVDDAVAIGGEAYAQLPSVYSLQNLDQNKPEFKEFKEAYTTEYGEADLTEHPAQTYDAIMILAAALEKTGGEGGAELKDALNETSAYEGASGREGSTIVFSADRHDGFQGRYLVAYKMEGPEAVQADLDF
jgi:branched-chain amino acid transport system substrate-binding protein